MSDPPKTPEGAVSSHSTPSKAAGAIRPDPAITPSSAIKPTPATPSTPLAGSPTPVPPSQSPTSLPPTSAAPPKPPVPPKPPNPVLAALGLPNIRPRLPSRNWSIFLGVTLSFSAAVWYDKRETARLQKKWVDVVSPVAREVLPANALPRRVKIYVQAPPGDNLGPAREMFYDYVKPVLVAGGLDWEVVEGRREGDVRFAVAEGIRGGRRKAGEGVQAAEEEVDVVRMTRERAGTREWDGVGGELVLGRHAWKEFVRGLHEGWLGPVESPDSQAATKVEAVVEKVKETAAVGVELLKDVVDTAPADAPSAEATPETQPEEQDPKEKEKAEEEEKRKKLFKPPPYNRTSDYETASLPRSIPEQLGPTAVVPFPHLIGFLGTPRRIYRFLNRRSLADDIGRRTAALVLASSAREFHTGEVEGLLQGEEAEWHKSVRKREREEGKEDVWLDPIAVDERVAGKMRLFELDAADEERASAVARRPKEEGEGA